MLKNYLNRKYIWEGAKKFCRWIARCFIFLFRKIKSFLISVRWVKLTSVLIISFILPLPNIFINQEYRPVLSSNIVPGDNYTEKIQVKNTYLTSASIVSHIVGEQFKAPAISICLENKSRPKPDGINATSTFPTDELGAISIKVKNFDLNTTEEIYAKVGGTVCRSFTGGIEIPISEMVSNNIVVMVPGIDQAFMYIDFGETTIRIRVDFDISKYLFESFVCFLAIAVILQVLQVFYRPSVGK